MKLMINGLARQELNNHSGIETGIFQENSVNTRNAQDDLIAPPCRAFDLGLAVSVPLPIVMGILVLLWFQSRLT